jgi:2-keto-4-pentenoate hydratase/2-oxohepta-3-ene-1,7-dioic acid hydratase in catechol pathway
VGPLVAEHEGSWVALAELPERERSRLSWLEGLAPAATAATASLPFQPRSFRDCMLYEQHWVDSSRGYARRFMPLVHRLSQVYEGLARQPFPPFRPHRLARRQPIYYFGNHLTFVASGTPIRCPSYARALDYELELGFVLKSDLLNASEREAEQAIGGVVVINDWTLRDIQREEMQTGMGPQKSKHFMSSMSSTLVSAEAVLPRIDALAARVEINGKLVCETSSRGMAFSPGALLAHLSKDEPLQAGELIATGTLPGGSGMENGGWLRTGDHLRLVVDGVGEITHTVMG